MTNPMLMGNATILLATGSDGLFAVSGEGCRREMEGLAVRGLAADGRGGALAIAGGHSLRRRGPGGGWTTVAESEFMLSCCMAAGETVYAGTDDARMLRLSAGGNALEPMAGFDHVAGRKTWYAGSAIVNGQRVGPPLGIRSVAANADGSVLFANVHVGGIPRSMDGGRSWEPTIAVDSDVHEVCAHPVDPEIVVAAAGAGLCISRDSGATWRIEREGLHAPHCSAVAIAGDDIFVSVAEDPFAAEGRIYRRPLGPEGSLTAVDGGLPAWTVGIVHTGCMAARGSLMALTDRSGSLYSSEDCGRTWLCRSTGLPPAGSVLIC